MTWDIGAKKDTQQGTGYARDEIMIIVMIVAAFASGFVGGFS